MDDPHEASGCDTIYSASSGWQLEQLSTHLSRWMDLPRIAVLGDTSSGKSSLLSAIAGIELPASHTLTTRCPVQLQMVRGDEKTARITIEWHETTTEPPAIEPVQLDPDHWSEIPAAIVHAQSQILQTTGQEVAHDVIHVRVQGPDYRDLTLLDLPGRVRSTAQQESATLVSDVETLLQSYLENPRCMILAVVPANVDFHNAQVLAEAKSHNALAVITKPDLVDPGAESDVLQLLLNEKVVFPMGFHMVKGRGQAALDQGVSVEESLEDELRYLEETEPWKSVEDRSILGTLQLRTKLADLQLTMVRGWLPGVQRDIVRRKDEISQRLEAMGEIHTSDSDKRRYYMDLCQTVVSQVQASLSGRGRNTKKPSGAASLHEACTKFMEDVRQGSLATVGSVVEGGSVLVSSSRGSVRGEVVHVDEAFVCVDYVDEDDKHSEILFDYVNEVSMESIEENDVWSDGAKVYIARKNKYFDTLKKIPLSRVRSDPSWLKQKIADNRTDDLACFLNVDIFKNIVEEFIEDEWRPLCLALLDRTRTILLDTVADALPSDRYPSLRHAMAQTCRHVTEQLLRDAHQQLASHLRVEKHPYTQDDVLFRQIAHARHGHLKRELELALRLDQQGVLDTQAMQELVDGVFARVEQKSVEDHLAEEMELVLASYGQVATRRVVDRTPMICWEVVRSLAGALQEALWNDETFLANMQERPEFAAEHAALRDELEDLRRALDLLHQVAV